MNNYKINIKEVVIYTLLTVAFIAGVNIPAISIFIGSITMFICLYHVILGKEQIAFSIYLVCATLSIEVGYFATGIRDGVIIYSFLTLPYIGTLGILLLNLIMFIKLKPKVNQRMIKERCGFMLAYLHKYVMFAIKVGTICLLITYILNDNNIFGANWYHKMIMSELFRMFVLFLTALNAIYILCIFPNYRTKLSNTMLAIMVSLVFTCIIGLILGFKGYRAERDDLSFLPLVAFFSFSLFAFPYYKHYKKLKMPLLIIASALMFLMIYRASPLGGKWFLSFILVVMIILYKHLSKKKFMYIVAYAIAFIIVFLFIDINSFFAGNEYMTTKLNDALDLYSYTSVDVLANSEESSSAYRVDELINIAIEYLKKPYYALFGKGLVGSITQHTGFMSWDGVGIFSEPQRLAQTYVRVHETINIVFLKYGLIGLWGFVHLLIYVFRSAKYSPWAIVGLLWLLFYVGVYQSMLFGLVAMIVAMNDTFVMSGDKRI